MPNRWGIALMLAMGPMTASATGLLEVYERALGRDTGLQAARARRDAAVESRPQALAAFLPQLNASAGLGREHYRYESDDNGVQDDPSDPQPDTSADVRLSGSRREWTLSLSQTLWSFEAFHRLQQAHAEVASAESTFRAAQQDLMLRVAQAYFDVLAANDTLSANRAEREAYGKLLDQAEKRLSTGLGARIGVDEARAFHELSAQRVIDAETALLDARRALAQITGSDPEALAPLAATLPLRRPDPDSADQWAYAALHGNFELRAAGLQAEAAQDAVSVARAGRLPRLSAQAQMGDTALSPALGSDYRADNVGVYLDWPIFSGGLVRSRVRAASAEQRGAEATLEGLRREIERRTRLAFRGVVAGIGKIRANRLAVEANGRALEASRNGVEVGTRTEFDLLNAQTNYYAALRSDYQARYDYLTNWLTLKALAGRLIEDDLAVIDGMLGPDAPLDLASQADAEDIVYIITGWTL